MIKIGDQEINDKILLYLQRADIILSSVYKSKFYFLSPTPIKHCSLYIGNNVKSHLIKLKEDVINNDDKIKLLKQHKIFNPNNFLNNVDKYINKLDNDKYYFADIQIKGFSFHEFSVFINKKSEIFVLRLINDNYIYFIYYYFLLLIGNNYSIFNDYNKYCYNGLIDLIRFFYNINFPYLKNYKYLTNIYFYNSLSFTKLIGKEFKIILIYKNSILKIYNN